ncbi:hypothetical protein T492DRAFT_919143 [Pavlovales sp. CCMP2436]|nr:hypothetical protein T492DRAFT_919143 [Pavlovales sp. CCMP2436]
MEGLRELVGAVVDHSAEVFERARLPPSARAELRELWLAKMKAAGMFDREPSPFPPLSSLKRQRSRPRGPSRSTMVQLTAGEHPAGPQPARLAYGTASGAWAAPRQRLGGLRVDDDDDERDSGFGRPQAARARPEAATEVTNAAARSSLDVLTGAFLPPPVSSAPAPPHGGQPLALAPLRIMLAPPARPVQSTPVGALELTRARARTAEVPARGLALSRGVALQPSEPAPEPPALRKSPESESESESESIPSEPE